MYKSWRRLFTGFTTLILMGCAGNASNPLADYEQLEPVTTLQSPIANASAFDPVQVEHGRYLVGLLGCGSCHTDGALIGEPNNQRLLAGSGTGIAYSNPLAVANPGVVYPSNLTPDNETGLGNWSLEQIVTMIRAGTDNHGVQTIPVMPWPAYANITGDDATA
ncbi:MAG: hypothetical protein WD772_11270, partial [Pseudohongiellaceae bacterium]